MPVLFRWPPPIGPFPLITEVVGSTPIPYPLWCGGWEVRALFAWLSGLGSTISHRHTRRDITRNGLGSRLVLTLSASDDVGLHSPPLSVPVWGLGCVCACCVAVWVACHYRPTVFAYGCRVRSLGNVALLHPLSLPLGRRVGFVGLRGFEEGRHPISA